MGEKSLFGLGLGDREQVGAYLNRLQREKQRTTEDMWRGGRGREGTCGSVLPSLSFPLSLFCCFFPISLTVCTRCSELIQRQHFLSPLYQCHKSNLPPLLWISVSEQTQQSNAPVPPPPQHSNNSSLADANVAYSQIRHMSTGQLCDHLTNLSGPWPREEHSLQKKNT